MSAEDMMRFLDQCNIETELKFRVAFHCGPVLKNVKASNAMNARPGTWNRIWRSLKATAVSCIPLYIGKNKELLLFYRYDRLEKHLNKQENREFLNKMGYLDVSVSAVLRKLRQRYERYAEKQADFPHELGIILEYPVEDVEDFIKFGGQNCLMERYWKVYHNVERARAVFAAYDAAKDQAMGEVIAGYPLHLVAVS